MDAQLSAVMKVMEDYHDNRTRSWHDGPFAFCIHEPCYSVLQQCPEYVQEVNHPDWIPLVEEPKKTKRPPKAPWPVVDLSR